MSEEFTGRLPFARSAVDRDAAGRSADIEALLRDPAARALLVSRGRVLMKTADPGVPGKPATRPQLLPTSSLPFDALVLYLGRSMRDQAPLFAGVVDDVAGEAMLAAGGMAPKGVGPDAIWGDLRVIGDQLDPEDAGLVVQAVALANWHASGDFSPRSGKPTRIRQGGWMRHDPTSGVEIFPRTDPAIIVAVTDADDRLLLGRNAAWGPGRFSIIAGFVEPGESLEAAVLREVFEETGLVAADPQYLGSQPWPFPQSIMLGFRARIADAADATPKPDGEEIAELRWFTRDEMQAAASSGEVKLPGRISISRHIIDGWYGPGADALGQW